jgi:sugar phosphate isomerase/epimerase
MHRRPVERWSMLNSLDAALDALNHCNHPRVGLVFDAFHMWHEPELCQRIPDVVPWIKLATLSDAYSGESRSISHAEEDRCIPGQGVLPLAEIVTALEATGYRGAYDVQLTGERCWRSDYVALLAECRAALAIIAPDVFAEQEGPRANPVPVNPAPVNPAPANPVPVTRVP